MAVTVSSGMWAAFARHTPVFPLQWMLQHMATETDVPNDVQAAYAAPFPRSEYLSGPRAMPGLVPVDRDDPESARNRAAWSRLSTFEKPFRTAFSDGDFELGMRPVDENFQKLIPGASGQRHVRVPNAGHFLQEDAGETVAAAIVAFVWETNSAQRGNPR